MNAQTVKTEVINNVMVAMSLYIEQQTLAVLEHIMQQELIRVNMEAITTLPAKLQDDISRKNQYLVQLFMIKKRHLSPKTLEDYLGSIKRISSIINNKALDQIDETDIEWYLSQYERRLKPNGKQVEDTTYNNERRFLSAFYTWMRKSKLISENPVEATEPKKVAMKPIDYYTPEQIARIRDACKNRRERAIIEVFRSTGARVGEIAEITLEQVDLETGDIWIQGEKGGKFRTLYLDDDAKHYYKLYLDTRKDDSPYLFPTSRKPYGKMTTSAFRNLMKTIGNRADLTCRVYPHKMRKTLGMNLKNRGVDIGTIQEIMGHSSPVVTSQYYAQSTPRTLRSVRERVVV